MRYQYVITGAEGQLGWELCRLLSSAAVPAGRAVLDITHVGDVHEFVRRVRPAAVINCAAYTAVDRAESEPAKCHAVNADAVGYLAAACREHNCTLVHISTDYVFGADTARQTPYGEMDTPGPQGVYAQTKLAGEQQAATWHRHFIVRTCGLYSHSPKAANFVKTILRRSGEGQALRVVDDQYCTPSNARHVARAVAFLLGTEAYGMYHVANAGQTTWCQFAREIQRLVGRDVPVQPITTTEFGAAAPRPGYSVLEATKYHRLGGPSLPSWQIALAEHLNSDD